MTNPNQQQQWWMEDEYIQTFTLGRDENGNLNTKSRPDLEKIVAEAERRGREAAWEEARRIVGRDWYEAEEKLPGSGIHAVLNKLDAKLTELKKV